MVKQIVEHNEEVEPKPEPWHLREDETGQYTERSPKEKIEKSFCDFLKIMIYGNYFIDEHISAGRERMSDHNCDVEKCVELNFRPDVMFSFFDHLTQKGLWSVIGTWLDIMSLTPRHLLSLIWCFCIGCCSANKAWLLILITLFGNLIVESDAGALITTNQELPPQCLDWFTTHHEDCPVKAEWDPSWDNRWGTLNHTCCSGFPGTVLHCQRQVMANFPACLPDKRVDRGHSGLLIKDDEGNPHFQIISCDSTKTFESDDTVSSNVTFPYCLRVKSRCNREGMERLCVGGTDHDDLCTCSTGYRPAGEGCHGNFTDQDECSCVELICSAGEVTVNESIPMTGCGDLMKRGFVKQFKCNTVATTSTPSPADTSQSLDRSEITNPVDPILNATDSSPTEPVSIPTHEDTSLFDVFYVLVIVFFCMCLLCLFAMACIAE